MTAVLMMQGRMEAGTRSPASAPAGTRCTAPTSEARMCSPSACAPAPGIASVCESGTGCFHLRSTCVLGERARRKAARLHCAQSNTLPSGHRPCLFGR